MGLRTLVSQVFLTDEGPSVVRECRRCGASVDADVDECPTCGAQAISVYELQ